MPRIDDSSINSLNKPFKKKNYRPWNLLDTDIFSNEVDAIKTEEIGKASENKSDTNRTQIGHKSDTNRTQIGHKKNAAENKSDTESDTKVDTNRTQIGHKSDTNHGFFSLVGLQRKIILLVYENCRFARNKITEPLSLEYISKQLQIQAGSVKTTIRRLEKKGYISRTEYKLGRSGWSRYELNKTTFSEMLQTEIGHKSDTNRTQIGHKSDTESDTESDTTSPSSSSKLSFNKKTTTSEELNLVDIVPLKKYGFTETHLEQILSQRKLSISEVQDSVNAFAYDLDENQKGKSIKVDPVSYFMGILRKGHPYAPTTNYEAPRDKAMRIYLERKTAVEEKRAAQEKEAFEFAFKDWFSALTATEKQSFVPDALKHLKGDKIRESQAREHFKSNYWQQKKEEIESEEDLPERIGSV